MTWLPAIALVLVSLWLGNRSKDATLAMMQSFDAGMERSTLRMILWTSRLTWLGATAAAVCAGLLFAR